MKVGKTVKTFQLLARKNGGGGVEKGREDRSHKFDLC